MDPLQWFEITKNALALAKTELDSSQIDLMILIHLDEDIQTFTTSKNEDDVNNSILFGQAWNFLLSILDNELHLDTWNSLTVKSRDNAITIFSLGFDVILLILYETAFDYLDVLKILLKYVFQIGYQKKYEIVGLVSAEGFPVWVSSIEEIDEFLFAISIISLLSLVERIDMEVSAGGVASCILQGNDNLLLNVAFNPSQDLALAVTQQGSDLSEITLDAELDFLYQKIVDPVLFSAIVPEISDEDREHMLEEIRQVFEGETTEEEIQTLNVFDTEMLKSLENEIKTVAKKYGANEISIGYLRKRMRLPSEVLSMALEFLIGEGAISGKIGKARKSGREILVLESGVDISEEDKDKIGIVQNQIEELFTPIKHFISQISETQAPEVATQEVITEALGEFQIILTLSDTDPLYVLTNDLRLLRAQLESSVKAIALVKTRLSERGTDKDDIFRDELERRLENLEVKFSRQRLTIMGKAKRFHEDLLNSYRLFSRLLPTPHKFKGPRRRKKFTILFKCSSQECETTIRIRDNPSTWIKLKVFSILLGVYDNFPEKSPTIVARLKTTIENRLENLVTLVEESDTKTEFNIENYLFIKNLNGLLITNAQRDSAINKLQQSSAGQSTDKDDFYSLFVQCSSCNQWYCKNHMSTATKCKYC